MSLCLVQGDAATVSPKLERSTDHAKPLAVATSKRTRPSCRARHEQLRMDGCESAHGTGADAGQRNPSPGRANACGAASRGHRAVRRTRDTGTRIASPSPRAPLKSEARGRSVRLE